MLVESRNQRWVRAASVSIGHGYVQQYFAPACRFDGDGRKAPDRVGSPDSRTKPSGQSHVSQCDDRSTDVSASIPVAFFRRRCHRAGYPTYFFTLYYRPRALSPESGPKNGRSLLSTSSAAMSACSLSKGKQDERPKHHFLSGNFALIHTALPLTVCSYAGTLPEELASGQYVRNGGSPALAHDVHEDAHHYHWFNGDGMLSGVYFRRDVHGRICNAPVLIDVFLQAQRTPALRRPLVPSIALFVDPLTSLWRLLLEVLRTRLLVLLSHFPDAGPPIRRVSLENTSVLYHDGRALATCESGPPMRFVLPGLETAGWFDGVRAEVDDPDLALDAGIKAFGGGDTILGWMKQWTTAHVSINYRNASTPELTPTA